MYTICIHERGTPKWNKCTQMKIYTQIKTVYPNEKCLHWNEICIHINEICVHLNEKCMHRNVPLNATCVSM